MKLDPRKKTAVVAIGHVTWDVSIDEIIPQTIRTPRDGRVGRRRQGAVGPADGPAGRIRGGMMESGVRRRSEILIPGARSWTCTSSTRTGSAFPPEELLQYRGKYIAWSPDGKRIVASDEDLLRLDDMVKELGYDPSEVVFSSVPDEETASIVLDRWIDG